MIAYKRIETYPLGDFLYGRSRFREQLVQANLDWLRYKQSLSKVDRDDVEKIERIFRKKEPRNLLT